jgi:excisionase family DNA binding protein
MNPVDEMYTIRDVCEKLKVNQRSVYRWITEGRLEAVKIGRVWRISEPALKAFIAGGSKKG